MGESDTGFGVSSKAILVVEDGPLVAYAMATVLADAGWIVIGPAGTVAEAKRLIEEAQFDVALLDANLGGDAIDEVAAALTRRNTPLPLSPGPSEKICPPRSAMLLSW
jgi:CheY-like chemotaxis protein